MKIILASKSPRRKQVLEERGYNITVDVSNADEESVHANNIQEKVIKTAKLKADTVAKRYDNAIIIAVDTMVYFNGKEIGQQKDKEAAIATLKKLRGKMHQVYSGICIMKIKNHKISKIVQDIDVTNMTLRNVSDKIIIEYVDGGHYKGKAGAYGIADPEFKPFIEKVEGSFTNVMGLPIEKVEKILKEIQA